MQFKRSFILYPVFVLISMLYVALSLQLIRKFPVMVWPDSHEYLSYRDCLKNESTGVCTEKLIAGRSPVVPVLYGIIQWEHRIVQAQIAGFLFSFLLLGFALFRRTGYAWYGLVAAFLLYLFSFNLNLFFWPKSLLSECWAILCCNLLLALFLLADAWKNKIVRFLLFALSLALLIGFIFMRDLHAVLAFVFSGLFLLLTSPARKNLLKAISFALIAICGFFINHSLVQQSGRYYLPTLNVFFKNYTTDPVFTRLADNSGLEIDTCIQHHTGDFAFKSPCYSSLDTAYVKTLYQAHQKWILTHPEYSVLKPMHAYDRVLTGRVYEYSQSTYQPIWMKWIKRYFADRFLWISIPVFIWMYIRKRIPLSRILLFAGTLLYIFGCLHLSYLADTNEIERHALIPNYLLRIVLLVSPVILYASSGSFGRKSVK